MARWIANCVGLSAMGALLLIGWTAYQAASLIRENREDVRAITYEGHAAVAEGRKALPTATQTAQIVSAATGTLVVAQNAIGRTSESINRPCGGTKPCGTLATLGKVAVKAGDAIVDTQLMERRVLPHTTRAMDALKDAAVKLGGTADQGTETLDTMNSQLKSMALERLSANLTSMTSHADAILGDGQQVTDKLTKDFVTPKPWYRKIAPSASDLWYFAARAVP